MLHAGDALPDVTATGAEGPVRLRGLVGEKALVIFFYPKDETTFCTTEACTFRDRYEDFLAAGAEVVGISSDPISSHEGFASKHRLPFPLLSDQGETARQAFGIKPTMGLLPGRATFVIDRKGTIRHAFSSQFRPTEHVRRALEMVRTLGAEARP